ncbi:MAG: glycosyltransferase family 2 protein [Candidatus Enteromonas sp.]|nr:glycosyltransferase family 2 protein [Candidatus Enteromonas sp.]
MDKIAVLIPCYNEEITIAKVIQDARRYLPESTIYVYDNNSTDATAKIAEEAGAIVRKEPRQGKGNVIRTMFRDIDAEVYLMVDGDDTYGLETAPEMVRRVVEDNADMVIGDRLSGAYYQENKRAFHNFGNNLVRFQINRLFHTNVKDIMTGYRAFSYRFVKTFAIRSKGFEIETEMTAHAADKNMLMSTLPITYRDRPEGSFSKLHTFRDGMKVLTTIGDLFRKFRPMAFYGFFCLLFSGLGIGFFIPVFLEFLQTKEVARFPTLIVCCFSVLIGLLCLFMGLLFSTLRAQSQVEFEHSLIQAQDAYLIKKNQNQTK